MGLMEVIGAVSAGVLLFAFATNQWGKLPSESLWYDVLNLIAGVGLFTYAYHLGSIPFMLINGVWGLVAAFDVVKDLRR